MFIWAITRVYKGYWNWLRTKFVVSHVQRFTRGLPAQRLGVQEKQKKKGTIPRFCWRSGIRSIINAGAVIAIGLGNPGILVVDGCGIGIAVDQFQGKHVQTIIVTCCSM